MIKLQKMFWFSSDEILEIDGFKSEEEKQNAINQKFKLRKDALLNCGKEERDSFQRALTKVNDWFSGKENVSDELSEEAFFWSIQEKIDDEIFINHFLKAWDDKKKKETIKKLFDFQNNEFQKIQTFLRIVFPKGKIHTNPKIQKFYFEFLEERLGNTLSEKYISHIIVPGVEFFFANPRTSNSAEKTKIINLILKSDGSKSAIDTAKKLLTQPTRLQKISIFFLGWLGVKIHPSQDITENQKKKLLAFIEKKPVVHYEQILPLEKNEESSDVPEVTFFTIKEKNTNVEKIDSVKEEKEKTLTDFDPNDEKTLSKFEEEVTLSEFEIILSAFNEEEKTLSTFHENSGFTDKDDLEIQRNIDEYDKNRKKLEEEKKYQEFGDISVILEVEEQSSSIQNQQNKKEEQAEQEQELSFFDLEKELTNSDSANQKRVPDENSLNISGVIKPKQQKGTGTTLNKEMPVLVKIIPEGAKTPVSNERTSTNPAQTPRGKNGLFIPPGSGQPRSKLEESSLLEKTLNESEETLPSFNCNSSKLS